MRYSHLNCLVFIYSVILISLMGCVSQSSLSKNPAVTQYEMINKSNDQIPTWINQPPKDNKNVHYLVGLSNYFSSEQESRQDAMRDARKSFADYTGINVKDIDTVIESLYGLSSEVLQASRSGFKQSVQHVNVSVSRIKAKTWYYETYLTKHHGIEQGLAYKSWVLVTVPASEYVRVQEWKQKQKEVAEQEKNNKKLAFNKLKQNFLKQCNAKTLEIQNTIKQGNIAESLKRISDENLLIRDFIKENNLLQKELDNFACATKLNEFVAVLNQRIVFDLGLISHRIISPNFKQFIFWLGYDIGNSVTPLSNLPIMLRDEDNHPVTKAVSDSNGQVTLFSDVIIPGFYTLSLNFDSNEFPGINKIYFSQLNKNEKEIQFIYYKPSLKAAIATVIESLFNKTPSFKIPNDQSFTIKVSGQNNNSELLNHKLKYLLEEALLAIRGTKIQIANGKITNKDLLQSDHLHLNYRVDDGHLLLNMKLVRAKTQQIIQMASKSVPIDFIPNILLNPNQVATSDINSGFIKRKQPNKINLEIISQQGNRLSFIEGETLSYFVSSDHDAYLLLIYQNADGRMFQIFPNLHSGNGYFTAEEYLSIPPRNANYEFNVSPPFGEENIWLFASDKPFSKLPTKPLSNGLFKIELANKTALLDRIRNANSNRTQYGETHTSFHTQANKSSLKF